MTAPRTPPAMGSSAYVIRRARMGDLGDLVSLLHALQDHLEAANTELWRMKAEARSQIRGQLAARIGAGDSCLLIAEHVADGVVGAISGRVVTNNHYCPARTGSLDQLFVQPAHRRQAVGTRLVAELCRWFAAQGVSDLSLRYVDGNAEAAAFWAALGFRPRIVTVGASLTVVEARLAQMRREEGPVTAVSREEDGAEGR